ncbi:succinate dehydrogenase assembly factor 3, mitochondrial [Protopterus annectens]|uniref:succinate dehydrogenase assembly factor 3, mitochondrial n=1 Tax=Protopterus annectens TaxID=7888 RepID=UPI001CFA13A0|nr:succinate dehydrogenase assembly factor 3, mitochondrial [Protopterus annectens]
MLNTTHLFRVRSLYKRILLLHKLLPVDLKALGDRYVKDEFKRNKTATQQDTENFMAAWEEYADVLYSQAVENVKDSTKNVKLGASLTQEKLDAMRDEQLGQLYELMQETRKLNVQFSIEEDNKHKK